MIRYNFVLFKHRGGQGYPHITILLIQNVKQLLQNLYVSDPTPPLRAEGEGGGGEVNILNVIVFFPEIKSVEFLAILTNTSERLGWRLGGITNLVFTLYYL